MRELPDNRRTVFWSAPTVHGRVGVTSSYLRSARNVSFGAELRPSHGA